MIKSMTGFGRCEIAESERKFIVEMKGVNHRYLDVNIRMPKKLNFFESAIRTLLKKDVYKRQDRRSCLRCVCGGTPEGICIGRTRVFRTGEAVFLSLIHILTEERRKLIEYRCLRHTADKE